MRGRIAMTGLCAVLLTSAAGHAREGYESGIEETWASFDGYVWEVGRSGFLFGESRELKGSFWFDHDWTKRGITADQYFAPEFGPVSEFSVGFGEDTIVHSGMVPQYVQREPDNRDTEVFFFGGQIGQNYYGLRFYAMNDTSIIDEDDLYSIDDGLMETDTSYDRFGNLVRSGGVWDSVEFIWYDSHANVERRAPVRWIDKPFLTGSANTPPDLVEAKINGINANIVLDEKAPSSNYKLELSAAALDEQGGVLEFEIDGDGPVAATATGPGDRRLSHSVVRHISGEDTGDTPHEFLFRVTDPTFGYANWIRTVTVRNLDPVIESLDIGEGENPFTLGELLAFSADASDPGRDPLTYEWDLDGDGLFDDYQGYAGEFVLEQLGLDSIGLRVRDDDGGETIRRIALRVVPEPSSAVLFAAAIASLLRQRRRA